MTENLMLIPGLNNTAEVWCLVQEHLPGNWRVGAVNNPPHSTIDQIAKELLEGVTEPFYVCGFSFGGYVALSMLEQAPNLVKGFILLASVSTADTEAQKEARKKAIQRVEKGEYFEMVEANAPLTFHPDSLQNDEIVKLRTKIVEDYGEKSFVQHVKATIERPNRTNVLNDAQIPKLIIAGKEDQVMPAEKLRQLTNEIPDAEFNVINHTGHMIPLEQPKELANVISHWIQKNR